MTFSEIITLVQDKLGLTGESTMIQRFIQDACHEIYDAARWKWREIEGTVTYATDATGAQFGTDVGEVLALENSSGVPLDRLGRHLFRDLYRGDTSTASAASVWCDQGAALQIANKVAFWPKVVEQSTGAMRYLQRFQEMSSTADVPAMPYDMHHVIVKGALHKFAEWEDEAPETKLYYRQTFEGAIAKAKEQHGEVEV